MPKSQPIDRFRISCECEVSHLGQIMVQLARIEGLRVTGNELITEVHTYANRPRQTHEVRAEDFLIDWLADQREFQAKEAVKHFRQAGRTDGAAYSALRELTKRKILKKHGEGRYSRLADKHQPKGLKAAKKAAKKQHDVDHRTFILRSASRNHGRFSTSWMKAQFVKDKRTPGNVSPTIAHLIKKKAIKRVGDSEYVLLQKAAKPKVNGNGATPVQEATHGAG